MSRPGITRIGAKMLIPYIFLLALYVQFHGDYGPGGGFQAGVIFAAGFILYALIYGLNATLRVMPRALVEKLVGLGVLLYAGVGIITMILGGNFLEYEVLTWGEHGAEHLVSAAEHAGDAAEHAGGDHGASGAEHAAGAGHDGGHGDANGGNKHEGGHGEGHGEGGHHGVIPQGQHLGLFLIEFGVGVTVFAVMLTIFYSFAGRGRS